ncbi:unnamed protein product, partial [Rotaria magnacalcarata]
NIGDQRLANCFEFNHHTNLDDLTLPYSQFERECSADYSFNTSISSASSITPTNSGMSSNYTYEFNELVLDLFKFLVSAHLIHAFLGINSRFDALVLNHFQTHGLDFRTISNNDFDTICQRHLMSTINRIFALRLSDQDDTSEQITRFYAYDFTPCNLAHLRSLSFFHNHSESNIHKLLLNLHDLSQLTHLTFEQCSISRDRSYFLMFVNNI